MTAALVLLLFALSAHAATGPADSAATVKSHGRASAQAVRAAPLAGTLRIDGRLDEPAWRAATPITQFTQLDPKEGEPITERTDVRFLIGEDALFVGARLYDSEPDKIRARLVRRDEDLDSDYLAVLIDAYHDHVTGSDFRVSAAGSINDASIGVSGEQDPSWDPVWHVQTTRDSLGWSAELEIPLSQLHYSALGDGVWGVQVRRWIHRKQELADFSFTPKSEKASVATYGHLTGLDHLRSPHHLEVMPYRRVRSEFRRVPDGDPFRDGADYFSAAGLDLKYGLNSNLTVNATVNPDFGEVEVDPAVVNLTAFETFFPERRPFFVEGADVFRFGFSSSYNTFNTTIPFHARRIGRPPQRRLRGGDVVYTDSPDRTTITAAAKLTGKTRNGLTIGVLDAVTPEELAQYSDTTGAERSAPVEPLSNYFVGRLRRDLRSGNTIVGGVLTAVHRDLADPALQDLLRSRAYVGGVDVNHYWAGRRWSLDGNLLVSAIEGTETVIANAQRSSARYFQRPDAEHLDYDPTRTRMSGAAGLLSLNRTAGKHWRGSLTYQDWSPEFEINDLGFQNAADSRALSSLAMYQENKPGKLFRYYFVYAFANHSWNYAGFPTYSAYAAHAEGKLANYWSCSARVSRYNQAFDDRLTRGGPMARSPSGGKLEVQIDSDSRKSTTVGAETYVTWDEAGGWTRSANGSIALRPASALRITLEPGIQKSRDNAQYITTVDDPLAAATYGARYVFARLDQTTLYLDTRVDWTFSPRLSLQLYAQPLIVSGDYADLKELRAPRAYEFDVYGRHRGTVAADSAGGAVVDPDETGPAPAFSVAEQNFNFRSLIGNAVLRWEYRPGSALFVVWQQNREAVAPLGDFQFSRDLKGLFRTEPENVLAVKITYWLGV
jgi:hypothetical protein